MLKKIPSIANLAATTALTAIENKVADHSKYISIVEFNKLKAENFTARLKQQHVKVENEAKNITT